MRITRSFLLLPLAALPLLTPACAKTFADGDGGGGGSSSKSGAGGGPAQCEDEPCGTPCETCDEPPCNQVCDGNGECRSDYNVTCSICPDGELESPSDGEDCPYVGLVCEYRYANVEDQFADCHSRERCTVNGWENDPYPQAQECYYWDPNATCPMVFPQHGSPCDPAEYTDLCDYGNGNFCVCTNCDNTVCEGSSWWGCVAAPLEPCPTEAPLLGHACVDEGLSCLYGAPWLEISTDSGAMLLSTCRICESGIWVEYDLATCGAG